MVRRALLACALAGLVVLEGSMGAADAQTARRPLTVRETIETRRPLLTRGDFASLQTGGAQLFGASAVHVSPDGGRYLFTAVRGDIARNGLVLELRVASLSSLESAADLRLVAELFSTGKGSASGQGTRLISDHGGEFRWLADNRRVAFFWKDAADRTQVFALDTDTGALTQLTHASRDVVSFTSAPDGSMSYVALADAPADRSSELLAQGFHVTAPDARTLIRGHVDQASAADLMWNTRRYLAPARAEAEPIALASVDTFQPWGRAQYAPDSSRLIADATPAHVPASWQGYDDFLVRPMVREYHQQSPRAFMARQVRQLVVIDARHGASRPLWDAPITFGTTAIWSPSGQSVLVGPTCLPLHRSAPRTCQNVAEVDVSSGAYRALPDPPASITAMRWLTPRLVRIEGAQSAQTYERTAAGWRQASAPEAGQTSQSSARVRIELRQDLNHPPVLYAVDTQTNEARQVFDLNPQLNLHALGSAEAMTWTDAEGEAWSGVLYRPENYDASRRYPLVIQTHGFAPEGPFSLYGHGLSSGLGPGPSIYAARVLAGRGMLVLQVEDKFGLDPGREAHANMLAYEGAIRALDAAGAIDTSRVGISGFSRTGWHVEYALTHSDFVFAAAITSDNIDSNYVSGIFAPGLYLAENGGAPYGSTLASWLERAPAFSVERIRTPLRLQLESGGLSNALSKWELFARLRALDLPVEFFIVPDIEHGAHPIQNPEQVLASQQGAVDWFDFWLTGLEDSDPAKAAQYVRWRAMRARRDTLLTQPRLPLLDWSAAPRD